MADRGKQVALLSVVAAIVVAGVQMAGEGAPVPLWSRLLGAGLLLAATGALWWRRRYPVLVLAATALAAGAYYLLGSPPGPEPVPFLVALHSMAESGWRRTAIVAVPVVAALVFLADPAAGRPVEGEDMLSVVAVMVAAVGLGEMARARREQRRAEGEQRREREERVATAERLRIARELHDTLAHQLTAISVQAAGALRRRDSRPELAYPTLETVRRVAGEALGEVREVLGVIRANGSASPRLEGARPGLAALPALGDRTGLAVALAVTGEPRPVPADVDTAAYRIAQEALTNVARHAEVVEAEVRLTYGPTSLVVEILDRGRGGAPRPGGVAASGGHGLAGMRERVSALAGEFTAGPRPEGGFRVYARLPLQPA
jgi:signal transduction histidine kinase